jgi:hypothetical protein
MAARNDEARRRPGFVVIGHSGIDTCKGGERIL